MTRADMIALERHLATAYRREAQSRRAKAPAFAAMLDRWSEAAKVRIEALRCGPLFEQEPSHDNP